MVTWNHYKTKSIDADGKPLAYCTGDCLSTDEKPTSGIYNGSRLYEMDTKKSYKYNAEAGEWIEALSGSGDIATAVEVREVLNNA